MVALRSQPRRSSPRGFSGPAWHRRAWLVAGLLLAGCYEPFPPSGSPCTGEGEGTCPTGQSCIRGRCRSFDNLPDASTTPDGPTPDGSAADLDGDMRPNANDNCPSTYNPDQHDEDGDTVGDVCDNCPHLANTNQARTGEAATPNGAGDACDPRPGQQGDTIQKFYPFHVLPPSTEVTTYGMYALEGDMFKFTDGEGGALVVTGARDKVLVEIGGTLTTTPPEASFGLFAGDANGRYYDCTYYNCSGSCGSPYFIAAGLGRNNGNGWQGVDADELQQPVTGAFTIRLSADSMANRVVCTTRDARGEFTNQDTNATSLLEGVVGVDAFPAGVWLRYLVIFGHP